MRLTIAQKNQIADSAVHDALEVELRNNHIELVEAAEVILNRETHDFKEVLANAPPGFFVEAECITVTVDGNREPLPLDSRKRVPHVLITGEVEIGQGRPGYDFLNGALIERDQLDRALTRMKSDLLNEVLLPANSLSGLVKKWPKVVDHLPEDLLKELKYMDRVDEILTRKEDD